MLAHWIAERSRQSPNRVAAIWNTQSFSYQAMAGFIGTIRADLAGRPPPRGVSVLLIPNLFVAWCWMIALRSLGHTTIALANPGEIEALKLGPLDLVVSDRADVSFPPPGPEGVSPLLLSSTLPEIRTSLVRQALDDASDAHGGHILLSSGTTGQPKKVLVTAAGDEADVALHANLMPKSPETRYFVGSFMLKTAAGYRGPLRTWAAGGAVIFHQGGNAPSPLLSGAVTDADFTPVTLRKFLAAFGDRAVVNNRMRLNILGGALPRDTLVEARARLTDRIYALFGATEAGVIAQTPLSEQTDPRIHEAAANRTVQIVGEAGELLSEGVGALRVDPAPGVTGYLDDDAATRAFFKDGFFYTGDLARWVGDGRFELIGRSSSVVNILGDKHSPEPIEQQFKDKFDLADVCIFSSPGAEGGDLLHVVIEAAQAPSGEVLGNMRRAVLAAPEVQFHFIASFPRNPMGKFSRAMIKSAVLGLKR